MVPVNNTRRLTILTKYKIKMKEFSIVIKYYIKIKNGITFVVDT